MSKKRKPVPDTLLLQCGKCDLILRFDEAELEMYHELPSFCHLMPEDDLEHRRQTCKGKRFKKPKGV